MAEKDKKQNQNTAAAPNGAVAPTAPAEAETTIMPQVAAPNVPFVPMVPGVPVMYQTWAQPETAAAIRQKEQPADLYSTCDPTKIANDVVIRVAKSPGIVQTSSRGTKRLKQGDRIKGEYYVELVLIHKTEGYQLANRMPEDALKQLELIRLERNGDTIPAWIKEAQEHKNPSPEVLEKYKRRKAELSHKPRR